MTQQQQQPHPMRCETCKNNKCPIWISSNRPFTQSGRKFNNEYDSWVRVINVIGCHYHSDAGKAERPCKHADIICHSPDECDYQDFTDMSDCDHPRCSKPFVSKAEQRIKDVIRELEQREKHAIALYSNATTKNEETYQQGIAFAYQRSIALLRGDER